MNNDRIFGHALCAEKVQKGEGSRFNGEFEIVKSTKPIYEGFRLLRFTISNPIEEKVREFKHKPQLYFDCGTIGHSVSNSLLWVLEKGNRSFYGRNLAMDKSKKDLMIFEFSKSGNKVNIIVSSDLLDSSKWIFYLIPYKAGEYESQLINLLSQLTKIERIKK